MLRHAWVWWVALALACGGPALGDAPQALARALVQADAWEFAEARAALEAQLEAHPGELALWLAVYELEGLDARAPRVLLAPAARGVVRMRARLGAGVEVPEPVKRYLDLLVAGGEADPIEVREVSTGTPWDAYLRIRRALIEPAYDPERLDALAEAAWMAGRARPFAFFLADRLAHLNVEVAAGAAGERRGLGAVLRERLRAAAAERVQRIEPALVPRYRLPYPPPRVGEVIARGTEFDSEEFRALEAEFEATPYIDDIRFYLACGRLARGVELDRRARREGRRRGRGTPAARQLRRGAAIALREGEEALERLAYGPDTNRTLPAMAVLVAEFRRKRRWTDLLGLSYQIKRTLSRWPDLERLQLGGTDALNNPEQTDFLIGLTRAQQGHYEEAIALYERAFAASEAAGLTDSLPPNLYGEKAWFHRARGEWRQAFEAFNEYSERSGVSSPGDWFIGFLRAAPVFVACVGINALHIFLTMLLAGVFLFSRAAANRPHFAYAAPLAVFYAAGMSYLLFSMQQPIDQAIALALGAGALIFMPTATGRSHWSAVCRPDWLGARRSTVWMVVFTIALMWGWTALCLYVSVPRHHPFWIFLRELPMMGPVAGAISSEGSFISGVLLVGLAGLQEEVIYRGFTLPVLARYFAREGTRVRSWWFAQLLTAGFWATAHAGMTEPQLWKFMHVFGLSIVLGELFRRRGLLPCIGAHALFNISALPQSQAFFRALVS